MQYKKKLTDIFMRKDQKVKKQPVIQKPRIQQFDESYFEAHLICDNMNTTLMKITATVKKGPNAGQAIAVKCKWYTKNQFDFKEIEDVKSNFFQPCLQDVGNIICVQLQPYIEGMSYTGITIMKESDQLKLDKKLENLSNQYFISKHISMEGKVENMYSQNPVYEKFEYPLEVVIELRDRKVTFKQKRTQNLVAEYEITEEYPQVDFIRKSFNSILFSCNQNESMKLSLTKNFNRDLFALIIRSIPSRISLPNSMQQLPETQFTSLVRHKSLIESSSQDTTKFILKIDQMNKQIKNLKRINQELTTNYHLQRNAKINLQNEIQRVKLILQKTNEQHKQCKPLNTKIKQVTQENKFFFGEISLLKNQLKEKNFTIKELKTEIGLLKADKTITQAKMLQLSSAPTTKIEGLEKQLQHFKAIQEQLEAQNESLKQTINELQNQKNVLKKKLTSIVSQKSLPSTPIRSAAKIGSLEDITPTKDPTIQIKQLKMQISNLQMLLKHKSGEKGGQMIGMQMLVNGLTEKIAEKQMEIQTLKKINKEMSKSVTAFSLKDIN